MHELSASLSAMDTSNAPESRPTPASQGSGATIDQENDHIPDAAEKVVPETDA